MTSESPAARLAALEGIARQHGGPSAIGLSLTWENEHGVAGVQCEAAAIWVFLFAAQHSVESLSEASAMLARIFADEIVAVTAYGADQNAVFRGLAPANDPSSGFNTMAARSLAVNVPVVSHVAIETWSRGLIED